MRTDSTTTDRSALRRDTDADRRRERPAADAAEVEQFRRMYGRMQEPGGEASRPPQALAAPAEDPQSGAAQGHALSAEAAALLHTHRLALDVPAPQAPPAPTQAALGALIERHVRRLLVSEAAAGDGRGTAQVMLRLSDASLPGTDLLLTRAESGWQLRAETASPDIRRQLEDAAPRLVERFAAAGLGELELETLLR